MLKKYLSKFTIDILPSVFATVVGAYIVNYYIIPKAREDRAPAAAVATVPDVKAPQSQPKTADAKPVDIKPTDIKPAETAAEVVEPSESAPVRKPVIDKAEKAETPKAADSRRHVPARDKAVATPVPTPVLATVGTAAAGDDRRDANDLARAAIDRLSRGDTKGPEAPRVPERTAAVQPQSVPAPQPVQQAQPVQQLPPPIVVSNPNVEYPAQSAERAEQPRGPRPPSDIPVPLRGDVQASAEDRSGRTNVAEDVLSAAKSMFDRVIPKPF